MSSAHKLTLMTFFVEMNFKISSQGETWTRNILTQARYSTTTPSAPMFDIDNKFSLWQNIWTGVLQGSIPGPLLINIFFKDIFVTPTKGEF